MELQIIERKEVLGKDFKVYGDFENPLFLAKDVAEWIEYNPDKVNELVSMVDDYEKLTEKISRSGQKRKMWFLTEDGLYEVLMQSRKPIAKKFKKKVKEILKTIRKNGMYAKDELLDNPDLLIDIAKKLKNEKELRIAAEAKRNEAIKTKAEIGSRREATSMNTASRFSKENKRLKNELGASKDYASVKRIQIRLNKTFNWRPLQKYSKENNLIIIKVPDENYDEVNAYHKNAWMYCYGINLKEIFGG